MCPRALPGSQSQCWPQWREAEKPSCAVHYAWTLQGCLSICWLPHLLLLPPAETWLQIPVSSKYIGLSKLLGLKTVPHIPLSLGWNMKTYNKTNALGGGTFFLSHFLKSDSRWHFFRKKKNPWGVQFSFWNFPDLSEPSHRLLWD